VLIGHGATDDGIGVAVLLEVWSWPSERLRMAILHTCCKSLTLLFPTTCKIIRNLIHHPVKHNVIFNINNGEEIGLMGAAAFMKHSWAKHIKAFVNLGRISNPCTRFNIVRQTARSNWITGDQKRVEGAGAGGRSFLFRASNLALVKFYSKVGNSPHANVFGNDIFKLGLIKR
jgi:Zn-dependent M28 family amino/carboxypeptidase